MCHGQCQDMRPDTHFEQTKLNEWLTTEQRHNAMCAKCYLQAQNLLPDRLYRCGKCKKHRAATEYSGALWKIYIERKGELTQDARCMECQYPSCKECGKKPFLPPPDTGIFAGDYLCEECRYPPCSNDKCKAPRERQSKNTRLRCPVWYCLNCRLSQRDYAHPRSDLEENASGS